MKEFLILPLFIIHFIFAQETQNVWIEQTSLLEKRAFSMATIVGEHIYVLGGITGPKDNPLTKVETLRINTNVSEPWQSGIDLPIPLQSGAATTYNAQIYVVGGYTNGWKDSEKFFKFDTKSENWEELPPLTLARGGLSAQWSKGILYVMGGKSMSDQKVFSRVDAFDPVTNQWTVVAPLLHPRHRFATAAVRGNIYAIGGRDFTVIPNVEKYNPSTNTWQEVAPLFSPVASISGITYDNRILVFGGETNSVSRLTQEYSSTENTWKCRTDLPVSMHGYVAVGVTKSIYVIGGSENFGLDSVVGNSFSFIPPARTQNSTCEIARKIVPMQTGGSSKSFNSSFLLVATFLLLTVNFV